MSQIVTWSSISGKPSFLEVGTYTGNGISKLVSTTGTGTPCFVLAQGLAGTGRPPYYKTTAMGSTNSLRIDNLKSRVKLLLFLIFGEPPFSLCDFVTLLA